jgi:hypothetical protein
METAFMVELFLGMVLVVVLGLLTMADLRAQFPCHPNAFPDDEDLDQFDWPRLTLSRLERWALGGAK